MYKVVLFDLDGTLTDSGLGIFNCAIYALEKFGIKVEDRNSLRRIVGPPLRDSFQHFYGMNDADADLAVKYYRERYSTIGLFENEVYEGIEEMLASLQQAGFDLVVATSKPEHFSRRIMDHFQLSQYFIYVAGSDEPNGRDNKAKVIAYALEQYAALKDLQVADVRKDAIMVGDRFHDIEGAKQNGLETVGILWGYGERPELENAGACYVAQTPKDVVEYLMK